MTDITKDKLIWWVELVYRAGAVVAIPSLVFVVTVLWNLNTRIVSLEQQDDLIAATRFTASNGVEMAKAAADAHGAFQVQIVRMQEQIQTMQRDIARIEAR